MTRVAETLGVSRSNLHERVRGTSKLRGPYLKASDETFLSLVRRFVDERPSYGYRRITALINRELARLSLPPANHKRVYRVMKRHALLLQRHTGRREGQVHEGKVIVMRSNLRWCSDGLEFTCWNTEVVRVAFAIDAHDREIIAWTAVAGSGTGAGISGSMVRDMMLEAVEKHFDALRAPHVVEWLADNGSCYTAKETQDFAEALNLKACFTPVRSPESNGMSEYFVKTFERDYVRINPLPDAQTALGLIDG